jgi:hypothetical protein
MHGVVTGRALSARFAPQLTIFLRPRLLPVAAARCCRRPIQASYASVITPGDAVKARAPIPLENLPAGTFDPLYRLPLDVQSGELPVLPLSIAGSVSMTHVPGTEAFLSGDEWFIYKFDKQQVSVSVGCVCGGGAAQTMPAHCA